MTGSSPIRAPISSIEPRAPFVGRAGELARLDALLEEALGGSGSIALVTGEPGIGKTALVSEFIRRARERHPSLVLCRGRCVEQYGAREPYLPFLDALGTLLLGHGREPTAALLRAYAPTWCLLLPAMAGAVTDAEGPSRQRAVGATRERMTREMGDVLEAAAAAGLLVAFLEDVQWADPATAGTVRHLVNRIARQRIILIGTLRPGEIDDRGHPLGGFVADLRTHSRCHEVALGPLDAADVVAYLDDSFGPHDLPAELPELIFRRTGGHPFLVTSLVHLLVDRGDIAKGDDGWRLARPLAETAFDTPESVRALVRRRVESLDDGDRRALQYASVFGVEFQSRVLAAVLRMDQVELEERLNRMDRVRRLVDTRGEEELPGGGLATLYRFSQAHYQEVVYGDLVSQRRVLMHREVGEALRDVYGKQAPRQAASLAYHFERGRDFSGAISHLVQAAENAERLSANEQAIQYLNHAETLVGKLEDPLQGEQAMVIHEKCGRLQLATSRFDEAAASFTKMLHLGRAAARPAIECQALSGLCDALFFSDRMEEMAVRSAQALAAAERAGRPALRAEAMLLVVQVLQHEGNLEDCRTILDEIASLAAACGHRRALAMALAYRGVVHYWQSEYLEAEERLSQALPIAAELHDSLVTLVGLQFLGLARGNRGLMSQALAALAEGIELGRKNGDRFWLPRLASHVGWVHRELEDFDEAIAHDREAVALARECRVGAAEVDALLNLGLDYSRAGRYPEAEEILTGLEARARGSHWFGWLHEIRLRSALAEHWMARGDRERSAKNAAGLLALAEPRGGQVYVATAHRILFDAAFAAGDRAGALDHANAAAAVLARQPIPNYGWRLHAALGDLHDALGDAAEARAAYGRSAAFVKQIAAGVTDPRLRSAFLESQGVRAVLARESNP